ncbi:MAG: hypothetical protein JWM80_6020 [Cyanobacteria bacterium RYN_339]|nr:hypothetical protein [Cyanobacteria bacterium RYN_339]
MSDKGDKPKPKLFDHAQVMSAFVRAFGKVLGKSLRGEKPLKIQVKETIRAIPPGTSRLWGKNARLIIEDGIAMLIDELQAELEVLDKLSPLIPEQPEGYVFKIQSGRLAMDGPGISRLMNRYAFPSEGQRPLTDIRVRLPDGHIMMDATFHLNRFMSLPLRMVASVSPTPDGKIELIPTEIRAGVLPVDRIIGLLGVELAKLMPGEGARGMTFRGNVILIDPLGMFPAPKATGRLTHVEISGDHMVMSYDDGTPALIPPLLEPEAPSYLSMVGHDLLVGKITMKDICLQLVPLDEAAGWVELSLPNYRLQLQGGESSLMYADELLYRLPPVGALTGALLPAVLPAPEARPSRSRPPA